MKQTIHAGLLAMLLLAPAVALAQAQQQARPGTERAAPVRRSRKNRQRRSRSNVSPARSAR